MNKNCAIIDYREKFGNHFSEGKQTKKNFPLGDRKPNTPLLIRFYTVELTYI